MADHRTTLTLYFCGSGNNLAPYKVAKFAIPYLVSIGDSRFSAFDGPGGNPKSKPEYLMEDGLIKVDGWGEKKYVGDDKIKSNYKGMTGRGANETIKKALQVIDTQVNSSNPVRTINLCGHSRGSVTAMAVAWGIQKLWGSNPNLQVNMFLYDPVAGSANEYSSGYKHKGTAFKVNYAKLPGVVNDFIGLFQTNLCSFKHNRFFGSAMPSQGDISGDYTVFAMPGSHNGACKYNMSNEGSNIGRIGLHLAYSFLKAHGSKFTENPSLSPQEVCEAYAMSRNPGRLAVKQKDDTKFFNSKNEQGVSGNRKAGLAKVQKLNDFATHPFFVNAHHRNIFCHLFPVIGRLLEDTSKVTGEYLQRLTNAGYKETVKTLNATVEVGG